MNFARLGTLALCALFFCSIASAEDGLVVHFTIKKSEADKTSTYSNAVLMRLTETSELTFPNQYGVRLESRAVDEGRVNLVVTLKDLSRDKPVYAGSGAATVAVGKSTTVPFHQLQNTQVRYEVSLDTSYGQLPKSAH